MERVGPILWHKQNLELGPPLTQRTRKVLQLLDIILAISLVRGGLLTLCRFAVVSEDAKSSRLKLRDNCSKQYKLLGQLFKNDLGFRDNCLKPCIKVTDCR